MLVKQCEVLLSCLQVLVLSMIIYPPCTEEGSCACRIGICVIQCHFCLSEKENGVRRQDNEILPVGKTQSFCNVSGSFLCVWTDFAGLFQTRDN